MRYYTYISTQKLAMLYPQTASAQRRSFSGEAELKIGPLTTKMSTQQEKPSTQHDQIDAVVSHLEESKLIGVWHETKPYIQGVLPLRWGAFRETPSHPSPVTFWSHASDIGLLVLTGSTRHVIGKSPSSDVNCYSGTSDFLHWLKKHLTEISFDGKQYEELADDDIPHLIGLAAKQMRGPETRCSFVAKILHRWNRVSPTCWGSSDASPQGGHEFRVILATPLFVAQE
jgi:hypothetical protein